MAARQGFHSSTSLKFSRDARAFGFKKEFFWYKNSCRVGKGLLLPLLLLSMYIMWACISRLWLFIAGVSSKFSSNITCSWNWLWIQQHSSNFRLGYLILVQLQSNVHLQMTVKDFPLSWQPNLHAIFPTVTFRTENLNLIVLPLFQVGRHEFYMPWYSQNL